jgi:hypothetical protein
MRRLATLVILLALLSSAGAQQQGQVFALQIPEGDLLVIGQALGKMPYDTAAPARLQQQINAAREKEKQSPGPPAKRK